MFGIQTQFNNGEITVNEYQKKLKTFLDEISTLAPDTQKAIKLIFGISTDKDGTTTSSIDTMVNNVKSTDRLMEYFKIGKLSSGKTESTINQYIRVVHQLCDFCHKEINMITTDDVLSFMVKYKIQNNVKGSTMDIKRKYLSSVFSYLYKHKKIADNPMITSY